MADLTEEEIDRIVKKDVTKPIWDGLTCCDPQEWWDKQNPQRQLTLMLLLFKIQKKNFEKIDLLNYFGIEYDEEYVRDRAVEDRYIRKVRPRLLRFRRKHNIPEPELNVKKL